MPAHILPFRRRGPAPESVTVTLTVDGVVVACEPLTPGGAVLVEVAAWPGGDWTAWLGRKAAGAKPREGGA